MDDEIWLRVIGFETLYRVSNFGRVRSIPKRVKIGTNTRFIPGRIMQQRTDIYGYKSVKISDRHRTKLKKVHQLVLEAFVGLRPPGMQCRHRDGDKSNNCLTNLCWGTPKENAQDKIDHGAQPRGENAGSSKLKDSDIAKIHHLYNQGKTIKQLGEIYGVSGPAIGYLLRGNTFKHCQPTSPALTRPSGFQPGNRAKGKLNDQQRASILHGYSAGKSYTTLAAEFGVSYVTIWNLVNGKSYRPIV